MLDGSPETSLIQNPVVALLDRTLVARFRLKAPGIGFG